MMMEDMIVEVMSSATDYEDSLQITHPQDVYDWLDAYIGKVGPWPSVLTYLDAEGEVVAEQTVFWATADGQAVEWRAIYRESDP
jgi:DNA repair protein RadC